MKDAESAEMDAIRKQKNKLVETLKKVNDDYTAAFASHAQTLKYLVLTEKRANDNAYTLDKISTDREAKNLKALEVCCLKIDYILQYVLGFYVCIFT